MVRVVVSLRSVYQESVQRLMDAGVKTPALDARLLLCAAYGMSAEEFILKQNETIDPALSAAFIARRINREPVSKILGQKEFWSLPFITSADVLDPRPDSEILIETVLRYVPDKMAPVVIADFGTGSGCLVLSLLTELPHARGIAVDISPAALRVAEANAKQLGLDARIRFIHGSWDAEIGEEVDIILSNPPYIPTADIAGLEPEVTNHDPVLALDGGVDGLYPYAFLCDAVHRYLKKDGFFIFEHGIDQSQALANRIRDSRLQTLEMTRDIGGQMRCIIGTRTG